MAKLNYSQISELEPYGYGFGKKAPKGTENKLKEKSKHDPQDYYSNDGQTVTPHDAEEIYKCLKIFVNEYKPKGIEKEIIESFLEWVARRDENNSVIDIPGFIIR